MILVMPSLAGMYKYKSNECKNSNVDINDDNCINNNHVYINKYDNNRDDNDHDENVIIVTIII